MLWLAIIAVIFTSDRITKIMALNNLQEKPIAVINNFFYFSFVENKGAAWGIFQNGRFFFIAVTAIVAAAMFYALFKYENKLLKLALSFVIGGALGNLYDRIFRGSVVDFLDFYFGSYNFPTFNVADSFVVMGTILLGWYLLFVHEEKKNEEGKVAEVNDEQ